MPRPRRSSCSASPRWPERRRRRPTGTRSSATREACKRASVSPRRSSSRPRARPRVSTRGWRFSRAASRWSRTGRTPTVTRPSRRCTGPRPTRIQTLTDKQKEAYADRGIVFTDRALSVKPNLIDSIIFKGLFLRVKASVTKDPWTSGRRPCSAAATRAGSAGVGGSVLERGPGETRSCATRSRPRSDRRAGEALRVGGAARARRGSARTCVADGSGDRGAVAGLQRREVGSTSSSEGRSPVRGEGRAAARVSSAAWPVAGCDGLRTCRRSPPREYAPALRRGVPTPVMMTVAVNFSLG